MTRHLAHPARHWHSLFRLDPRDARSLVQTHLPVQANQEVSLLALADYSVLRNATVVLFTTEHERRLASQSFWLYKANDRVVGYSTAAPAANPERHRQAFFELFPQLRGKSPVLFLSRILPKKGVDVDRGLP